MDWEQEVPEGAELGGHGPDRAFTLIHGPSTEHDNKGSKSRPAASDLDAADACLALLQSSIDEAIAATDVGMSSELFEYVTTAHRTASETLKGTVQAARYGKRPLPTALVLTGGVNSADHSQSFPALSSHLKEKGCYIALVGPADFGKAPGVILQQALKSWSNLSLSPNDVDVEALCSWYAAETGGYLTCMPAPVEDSKPASRLRHDQRSPTPDQVAASKAPLVLIVEGAEMVDSAALRDLILVLSEGCWTLPVTLVLGLTSSALALQGVLEPSVLDRCLSCTTFKLASVMDRLDRLVSDALLGNARGYPALLFGPSVIARAWELTLLHHFSSSIVAQCLRVAALDKLALCGRGKKTSKQASSPPEGCLLQQHLDPSSLAAWARWALAIHWVVHLGRELGMSRGCCEYWRVFRDALQPGWIKSDGNCLLSRLVGGMRTLEDQRLRDLILGLLDLVRSKLPPRALRDAETIDKLTQLTEQLSWVAQAEDADATLPTGTDQGDARSDLVPAPGLSSTRPGKAQFHSRTSRRNALLGNALASMGNRSAERKRGQHAKKSTPRQVVVDCVLDFLNEALSTELPALDGMSDVIADQSNSLDCLTGSPRQALVHALLSPEEILGSKDTKGEDTCIAFQLFDADPNCQNVAEWFESFAAAGGPSGRTKSVKKRADPKVDTSELAARFSQATAELQFLGLIRPATRRKVEMVQRCMHMPALH